MQIINKPLLFTVSSLISLGSFVFGYSLVSISMMASYLADYNHLTQSEKD